MEPLTVFPPFGTSLRQSAHDGIKLLDLVMYKIAKACLQASSDLRCSLKATLMFWEGAGAKAGANARALLLRSAGAGPGA